ncbi:MAG: hypothetical protein K2I70_01000 [Bacilli bacterium]|nr:hypothetical protein [Bacilli bacterium]
MTIQDKIQQLRECLSNQENSAELSNEELQSAQIVVEEANKIFELGDISRMDPDLLEEICDKWNNLIDSKLSLFAELNTEIKHRVA